MATPIWQASIKDDITAQSQKMAFSLKALDATASSLFKKSGGDFKKFEQDLRKMGVSAMDAKLSTERYRKELIETRRELLGLGNAADRTGGKLKQITIGALRSVGEKVASLPGQIAGGAMGLMGNIASQVADTGKSLVSSVIEAAEFRQNALTGLEYMLGTKEEAESMFAHAQKMAAETPLDTDKVIQGIQTLVTQGFSGEEAKQLYKLVADQQSKNMQDSGMQDKVISAFSRIKGRGVASGEDMESLLAAGFRSEGIVKELLANQDLAPLFKKVKVGGIAGGKTTFVDQDKATNEDKLKMVKEVLGSGKIGTYTLLNAVIAATEKGKDDIGQFASKMGSKALTGSISNFKNAFGDLLKSTSLEKWDGIQKLIEFLNKVSKAMQGEGGKQLLGTIEKIVNTLFGGLEKIKDSDINGFISMIGTLGEQAVGVIKQAWEWLDKLLHSGSIGGGIKAALLDVAKLIGAGVWYGIKNSGDLLKSHAVEDKLDFRARAGGISQEFMTAKAEQAGIPIDTFMENFSKAKSAFYAGGGSVDYSKGSTAEESIYNAISASATAQIASQLRESMLTIGNAGAEGLQAGVKEPLQIHSPSRTMAYLGEMAAKGLVEGTEKGVETAEPVSGGRGCSVTIGSINVGSGYGDAEAAGMAIARVVEREVMAVFERAADE